MHRALLSEVYQVSKQEALVLLCFFTLCEYPQSTLAELARRALLDGMPTSKQDSSKTSSQNLCRVCETASASIIDGVANFDETADIVIVGGGPHALACLSAIHEGIDQEVDGMYSLEYKPLPSCVQAA